MNFKRTFILLTFLLTGLTTAGVGFAQTSGATLSGRAADSNNAAVAGASVELTNLGTNAEAAF